VKWSPTPIRIGWHLTNARVGRHPARGCGFLLPGQREECMKKVAARLLAGFVILGLSTFIICPSHAQTFPSQPIQMVITLAPGDTLDLTGRAIAAEMAKILKRPGHSTEQDRRGGNGWCRFCRQREEGRVTPFFTSIPTLFTLMPRIRRMFHTIPFRIWSLYAWPSLFPCSLPYSRSLPGNLSRS